ncbi:MAG TPA: thioredoxin [Candidatus Dojkabacteria bacterium]|nr:thioredoxin [Candidatus Dojkabacteria bacterium]
MSHLTLDDNNFAAEIESYKGVALVDMWAPWCMPCQMLGPVIEEVANEIGDKAKVGKLNVDENVNTATKYNVSSIPYVVVFKDGQIVDTLVGIRPKQEYIDAINKQL